MFQRKTKPPKTDAAQRSSFPTFRRLARFTWKIATRLPFVSRAWWKRNYRRFAAVCLVFAAIWTATNIYATVLLNRELEAIRQRGEPLSVAELAPPPVPDDQNAAILYRRASEKLKQLGFTQDEDYYLTGQNPQTNERISEPQLSLLRHRLLQKYRPAIELIRQASRLPSCRFPTKWQEPAFTIFFPDLAPLRKFARLMRASAIQEARDGQTAQAIEDVGAIYRIGEHANTDPIFIALLVSNAIEQIGDDALSQVFEYSNLTLAQKSQVEAILPIADKEKEWRRALQGERAFGLSGFNDFYSSPNNVALAVDGESNDYNPPLIGFLLGSRVWRTLWLPAFKLDQVWYLRAHPANLHAVPLEDVPIYAVLTQMLMPVFAKSHQGISNCETLRDLARVALELNVYRTQNKSYPATLAQLEARNKTRLPLDSFSQKAFVYKRLKTDYTLYSVGPNKTDDGGRDEHDFSQTPSSRQQTPSGSWLASPWDDINWPPNWFTRHSK